MTSASVPEKTPGSGTARPSAERRSLRVAPRGRASVTRSKAAEDGSRGRRPRASRASRRTASTRSRCRASAPSARRTPPRSRSGRRQSVTQPGGSKTSAQRCAATAKTDRACAKWCVRGKPRRSAIGAELPELPLRVPPPGAVHLAEAGDDEAELQKSFHPSVHSGTPVQGLVNRIQGLSRGVTASEREERPGHVATEPRSHANS